jgi:hypothetical protein
MTKEELDLKIEEWHKSDSEQPLHEYLGMTLDEYFDAVNMDIMPKIVKGS